jgi:hypothetical protein
MLLKKSIVFPIVSIVPPSASGRYVFGFFLNHIGTHVLSLSKYRAHRNLPNILSIKLLFHKLPAAHQLVFFK